MILKEMYFHGPSNAATDNLVMGLVRQMGRNHYRYLD
jgi:hypothetical protein